MLNIPRFSQHSAVRPEASSFALELTDRAKICAGAVFCHEIGELGLEAPQPRLL